MVRRIGSLIFSVSLWTVYLAALHGLQTAKELGLVTVGLTGETGGDTKATADYCICVPSRDTARI